MNMTMNAKMMYCQFSMVREARYLCCSNPGLEEDGVAVRRGVHGQKVCGSRAPRPFHHRRLPIHSHALYVLPLQGNEYVVWKQGESDDVARN